MSPSAPSPLLEALAAALDQALTEGRPLLDALVWDKTVTASGVTGALIELCREQGFDVGTAVVEASSHPLPRPSAPPPSYQYGSAVLLTQGDHVLSARLYPNWGPRLGGAFLEPMEGAAALLYPDVPFRTLALRDPAYRPYAAPLARQHLRHHLDPVFSRFRAAALETDLPPSSLSPTRVPRL